MLVTMEDLDKAAEIFHSNSDILFESYVREMNKKHKIVSTIFTEFERKNIDGIIIDELMISILAIWYVVEKKKYKRISEITELDCKKNVDLLNSFLEYNSNHDYDEQKIIDFFLYEKDLVSYAVWNSQYPFSA